MSDQVQVSQEQIDGLIQHYENLLNQLREIESKEENEGDDEDQPSKLDEFRRSVCGCVFVPEVEKPQEAQSEDASAEKAESENNESQQKKAELYKKTDKSQKLLDDLSVQPFSPVLAEKLSKVIAEICKEGRRVLKLSYTLGLAFNWSFVSFFQSLADTLWWTRTCSFL